MTDADRFAVYPKNPDRAHARFAGVGGETVGSVTEPRVIPVGQELLTMTDGTVTPVETHAAPTSAREGVTERIAEQAGEPSVAVTSRGLTGPGENRMDTGAPDNRTATDAKPAAGKGKD